MLGGARRSSIDNRYRPLGLLGRGGMGEVHLARDEVLGRDVAVKVLAEQYSHDGEAVERFRREARSAAALSHPHVVPVHDLGETADGAHYIVMEYVPGGTLKERILRGAPWTSVRRPGSPTRSPRPSAPPTTPGSSTAT